ncbi:MULTISPECIES: hypothetical protein [unclassified Hyphomicrobium]|uniref:hypothetical protein n=1 Tax=unclassified Hyphomicrobium TaxID=2619925 RepID=UPI00045EC6FD|nr:MULTISPECIES: hypothetical protein [unclassified Hyphomicrobium]
MTYPGIILIGRNTWDRRDNDKDAPRKVAYNLFAVVALMVAAGIIVSAAHPINEGATNPRFESMGVSHIPTTFRGAPPTRGN